MAFYVGSAYDKNIIIGNMVSYTLSGLNIPLASGSGNIKSRQRIWDDITCLELKYYTIIDFWWGLLMTMKTASGIGWPTPKAEVNQYLTRSSWSWVDRNQKSIIALLNYREFSFTKIEISIATAFYRTR